jgi:methyltransferase (TIGR00027 family)
VLAKEELPIRSALMIAALRAVGAREPVEAHRNPDMFATHFMRDYERGLLAASPVTGMLDASVLPPIGENLPVLMQMLRTRHIDEECLDALRGGAEQVVILGAGLDTRAHRFGEALAGRPVFEVDLPSTQQYKRRRIAEILGSAPEGVIYVPIDFTRDSLHAVLAAAGWNAAAKTFFLWEGVSFYLTAAQVHAVLDLVATVAAPGSRVVFDYLECRVVRGEHEDEIWKQYIEALENWGERFVFGIGECSLRAFLRDRGLSLRSDLTTGEICTRYCPAIHPAALGVSRSGYHFCVAERA